MRSIVGDGDGFDSQEAMLRPRESAQGKGAGPDVQRKAGSAVQRNPARDLWYGITHLPEVIEGNRQRDEENAISELATKVGHIRAGLDVFAAFAQNGSERVVRLGQRVSQISSALAMIEYAETVDQALRVARRWRSVDPALATLRANPSRDNAMAAARAMGDVISPLGSLLSNLPAPVGSLAGLLEGANGDFFAGTVGNILHSERRLQESCLNPVMRDVPMCR